MKKNLIYSTILICALLLQTGAIPVLFGPKFMPDLLLMLVLAWTIRDGFSGFLSWIIFAGLAYDLLAYAPVGTHVLIFSLSAYMVSFFSRLFLVQIRGAGVLLLLSFVFLAMLFSRLAIMSVETLVGGVGATWQLGDLFASWNLVWWEFFFNAIFIFFGLWLSKHVKRYFFIQ